jgi:hypothetical protein
MPIDPWSNDYMFNVQTGAIWSMGPNGTDDTLTDRVAGGDDILATWKPDFFINGAKRINNRVLEISFSRKVDDSTIAFGNVTVGGAPNPTSLQKISATIFRVTFDADLASTDTITVADTVEAIDGRTLATAEKPDGSDANTITY